MKYNLDDYKDIKAEVVMVTPKMAAEMLTNNYSNRPISKRDVVRYADAIKAGKWEVTCQGIGLSKNGSLKDGQHRLSAIVLANIPAPMLVVTGIANDAKMIDRGKIRSIANVWIMGGMSKELASRRVVAAGKALMKLCDADHATELQLEKLVGGLSYEIVKAVPMTSAGSGRPICDKAVCYAAAICALKSGISETALSNFFKVANAGFAAGDYESSAIVFRNYLLNNPDKYSNKKTMMPAFTQCTKAIKDFCDNKPRRIIYTGDPVFFTPVKEYIEKEIL